MAMCRDFLSEGTPDVLIRMEQRDIDEIKKQYEIMLQQIFGKDLIEIDSDQSLESILITYKSDFYTGNSSVAIYASTAGTKCYSFIDFLCKKADYYKQFRCLMYDFCTIIEI